jgi:hypothetical protein
MKLYRLTYWIASLELLLAFALADAAIVGWSAGLVTTGQVLAWAFTYTLIALGALVTTILARSET